MSDVGGASALSVGVVLTQLGFGGAERQTVELLRRLVDHVDRPRVVICMSDDLEPFGGEITAMGYPLRVLSRARSFDAKRLLELRREFRRNSIRVVHAVHVLASGYAYVATRGIPGVAVLPSVRGTVIEPGRLRSWIYRRMFRSCRAVLVNSHRGGAFIRERFGAPAEAVRVVPNGIDFKAIRERIGSAGCRERLGIPKRASVIGYVGKLSAVKNVPRFLEAWKSVAHDLPESHAVLIGRGLGADSELRAQLGDLQSRTHLVGSVGDAPAWIASFDVLVLTSDSEGSPNVVLEALAVGTPVVSTDVGDVSHMLRHGETGWIVAKDGPAVAKGIRAVLSREAGIREAIRGDAARLNREFSVDAMVQRTVELWHEIDETVRVAGPARRLLAKRP